MKKLSALTVLLILAAASPSWADDFGARFGGTGTTALEDTGASDAIAGDLQNIAPAAGDAAPADPEAQADAEAGADITTPAASIETQAGATGEAPLSGASEPEATQEEKNESNIIHYDKGMSPDDANDASYRLQDTAD